MVGMVFCGWLWWNNDGGSTGLGRTMMGVVGEVFRSEMKLGIRVQGAMNEITTIVKENYLTSQIESKSTNIQTGRNPNTAVDGGGDLVDRLDGDSTLYTAFDDIFIAAVMKSNV
ncbi:hypothetical protein Hanom_Chr15g01397791 [Helianthus anomalus]